VTQQPHCDCSGGVSREPEDDGTELAESDEEPQFNRDHYSKGLNANFLCGTTDEVVGLHAGEGGEGGGRFENVETRDIARGLPAVLSAISSVARLDGATVADIGAGTGLFLEPFRRSVGDRGSVYAVELSEHFCKHLAKKAKQNPRGAPVKVVQCTDTETRLPTASVDVAFICDVYHHFEYPKTFMKSLMTSMKPGGTVVVVDFHRDEAKITSHPPGWITAHVRADQATFRAEIESAGFTYVKDLEVVELQENYGEFRFSPRWPPSPLEIVLSSSSCRGCHEVTALVCWLVFSDGISKVRALRTLAGINSGSRQRTSNSSRPPNNTIKS
jgi:SAM-dependent methyltransferase